MTQSGTKAHRIRIEPTNSHVVVALDGVVLAESDRALSLHEGSIPTRYYVPRDDVRMELLTPTEKSSHCPFKGDASYWSAQVGDRIEADLVWSYLEPIPGAEPLAGLLAFYNDRVEIKVEATS